ncbi:uncharacterized protein LOC128874933 isoform X2 [Hylaeus volcanicus]|uniref:uncharacterized protein LOC128874933 isoform X2 n=1 Tax=Hylaeus volcanicus TaxID=313075 RepID=UPI0023B77F78|nr:uncharacterized protein LOC128874933 isoform X2 [Hylaeus volcanicus]
MGQTVGRMPDTWDCLLEEKDRVLHWSAEVLSRVADNVNQEESFQMDYDNERIDEKIDSWIEQSVTLVGQARGKHARREYTTRLAARVEQIREDLAIKMRNDYRHGYRDIKKFTKKVDHLGKQQRKIHAKIHELEIACAGDVKKFQKKFGPLRLKTFKNLRLGEKMMFEDKRLKTEFVKRVYDIDHKNMDECGKRIRKLTREH